MHTSPRGSVAFGFQKQKEQNGLRQSVQSIFLPKELLKGGKAERAVSVVYELSSPSRQVLVEVSSVAQSYADTWKCVQERSHHLLCRKTMVVPPSVLSGGTGAGAEWHIRMVSAPETLHLLECLTLGDEMNRHRQLKANIVSMVSSKDCDQQQSKQSQLSNHCDSGVK